MAIIWINNIPNISKISPRLLWSSVAPPVQKHAWIKKLYFLNVNNLWIIHTYVYNKDGFHNKPHSPPSHNNCTHKLTVLCRYWCKKLLKLPFLWLVSGYPEVIGWYLYGSTLSGWADTKLKLSHNSLMYELSYFVWFVKLKMASKWDYLTVFNFNRAFEQHLVTS